MRRRVKSIDYTQRVVDLFIVYMSWMCAYFLKFESDSLFSWYANYGVLLLLVSLLVFKNSKLYDALRLTNTSKLASAQIRANALSLVAFLVIAFFMSHHRVSRVMLIIYFVISTGLLILSKIYFRKLMNSIKRKILIIGHGWPAKKYVKNIE